MNERPVCRKSRDGFHIAIICGRPSEANAVQAVFDHYWEDDSGELFSKADGDPNAYSTGTIGHHNVVLAYMPGTGKSTPLLSPLLVN